MIKHLSIISLHKWKSSQNSGLVNILRKARIVPLALKVMSQIFWDFHYKITSTGWKRKKWLQDRMMIYLKWMNFIVNWWKSNTSWRIKKFTATTTMHQPKCLQLTWPKLCYKLIIILQYFFFFFFSIMVNGSVKKDLHWMSMSSWKQMSIYRVQKITSFERIKEVEKPMDKIYRVKREWYWKIKQIFIRKLFFHFKIIDLSTALIHPTSIQSPIVRCSSTSFFSFIFSFIFSLIFLIMSYIYLKSDE